jgi:hypothetical protein
MGNTGRDSCEPGGLAARGKDLPEPQHRQGCVRRYVVHLNGITSSLFNGSPSESTTFFTFSTDVLQLTPMPNNGDVALDLVSAGTFSVYYNASPNGDWSNPATFSSGKLIAPSQERKACTPKSDLSGFIVFQKPWSPARASHSMSSLTTSIASSRTGSLSPSSSVPHR